MNPALYRIYTRNKTVDAEKKWSFYAAFISKEGANTYFDELRDKNKTEKEKEFLLQYKGRKVRHAKAGQSLK